MTKRPLTASEIINSLQNNDSFLMGLYEIFVFLSNVKPVDISNCQSFLVQCISLIRNQPIRAGHQQLDHFICIVRNAFAFLFLPSHHTYAYVNNIIRAMGYASSPQTFGQNTSNATPTNITPNLQKASINVTSDVAIISSQSQLSGRIMQSNFTPFNPPTQIQTSTSSINNIINDMFNTQNSGISNRINNDTMVMSNDSDSNAFNLQMIQNGMQQQNVAANNVNIPMQFMNFQPVRHPQAMQVVGNQEDAAMAQFARFPGNMGYMNARIPGNNVVFLSNQMNRPTNAFVQNNPQMIPQNAFILNNPPNIMQQGMQQGMQQMRMNRQMAPQNIIQVGGMRGSTPINVQNQMIRQQPMYFIPQNGQAVPNQILQQFVPSQGIPLEQQADQHHMAQNLNNPNWMPNNNMQIHPQSVPSNIMCDNMMIPQNMSLQMTPQGGMQANMGMIPSFMQTNQQIRANNVPPNLIAMNPDRNSSQQHSHIISRPTSDTSRPSVVNYHSKHLQEANQNLMNVDRSYSFSRNEQEQHQFEVKQDVESNVPPTLASQPSSPNKSICSGTSRLSVNQNNPLTSVRLCNTISTCDSSPSLLLMNDVLPRINPNLMCLSCIPNSTFLEIIAKRHPFDYTYRSKHSFVIRDSLFDSTFNQDHLEFQLKCMSSSNVIMNWPDIFSISLNGHVFNNVVRSSELGDEGILIKNVLHKDENVLNLECFVHGSAAIPNNSSEEQCPPAYKFYIHMVLRASAVAILRAVCNKRTQSFIKSIEFVQQHFVQNPMEMARGYTIVSFYDPLDTKRISLPVRTENCKHVQCLDFHTVCMYYCNRTTFLCPICQCVGSIQNLVVDGFLCTLLVRVKSVDDVSEIRITPECNWSVHSARQAAVVKSEEPLPPPVVVENMVNEDNIGISNEDLEIIFGASPLSIMKILNKPTIPSHKPLGDTFVPNTPSPMILSVNESSIISPKRKRSFAEKQLENSSVYHPDMFMTDVFDVVRKKRVSVGDAKNSDDAMFFKSPDTDMVNFDPHLIDDTGISSLKNFNCFDPHSSITERSLGTYPFTSDDNIIDADPNLSITAPAISKDLDGEHLNDPWDADNEEFLKGMDDPSGLSDMPLSQSYPHQSRFNPEKT